MLPVLGYVIFGAFGAPAEWTCGFHIPACSPAAAVACRQRPVEQSLKPGRERPPFFGNALPIPRSEDLVKAYVVTRFF